MMSEYFLTCDGTKLENHIGNKSSTDQSMYGVFNQLHTTDLIQKGSSNTLVTKVEIITLQLWKLCIEPNN